jgi:hypothetical protein
MVDYSNMFRADPRIARRRKLGEALQAQALRPIQATANPYGFSPWGEAAQRLAAALGSNIATSAAEKREAEQRAARGQVMAQLLKVGSARPDQLIQTQMQEPGPGAMMRTQYSIGNDGAQIPTLDPAIMKTAGLDPAMYQVALAAAKAQGDTLTQAGLEKQIKTRLGEIGTMLSGNPDNPELLAETEQLRALLVPEDVAKETVAEQRSKETERRRAAASREKELRKLAETTQVVIDKRPDSPTFNQLISITKQQLLNDIESAEQGNPRAFGAPEGLRVGAGGRLVAGRLGKKDTEDFAAGRLGTAFDVSRAMSFIDTLETIPGVAGFRGAISEFGGGLIGQIPVVGKDLERAFTKTISDATPEQRSQYVVTGRAIIGSMIDDMSGEQSKRFSEPERKIAEQALKNMQPGASATQIIGATQAAVKGYMIFLAKADLAIKNKPVPIDDDEALVPYVEQLERLGFGEDDIIDILTQIDTAYKLLPDMVRGQGG